MQLLIAAHTGPSMIYTLKLKTQNSYLGLDIRDFTPREIKLAQWDLDRVYKEEHATLLIVKAAKTNKK